MSVRSCWWEIPSKPRWTTARCCAHHVHGEPLYDRRPDEEGRFVDLDPGRYGLVAIDDVDGNGRWTGVDPATMRAPEGVTVVSTDIEVRAGWEVELVRPDSSTSLI